MNKEKETRDDEAQGDQPPPFQAPEDDSCDCTRADHSLARPMAITWYVDFAYKRHARIMRKQSGGPELAHGALPMETLGGCSLAAREVENPNDQLRQSALLAAALLHGPRLEPRPLIGAHARKLAADPRRRSQRRPAAPPPAIELRRGDRPRLPPRGSSLGGASSRGPRVRSRSVRGPQTTGPLGETASLVGCACTSHARRLSGQDPACNRQRGVHPGA